MSLLEILIVLILVLWLLGGLVVPVSVDLVRILIVILLILVVVRILQGRGSV